MKTTRADCRCPACDFLNDAHSSIDNDATPSEGDYAVCLYCAYVGIFTFKTLGALSVRHPLPSEKLAMDLNPKLVQARTALLAHIAIRKAKRGPAA
jgi:hypothetical protein